MRRNPAAELAACDAAFGHIGLTRGEFERHFRGSAHSAHGQLHGEWICQPLE
jgi:hypothetical protein